MPGRRSPSSESFRSIDLLNAGDSRNSLSNRVKLPQAWKKVRNINGVDVPTFTKETLPGTNKTSSCDVPPIVCSICYGPVVQATSTLCGHIYCHDCISRAKQYDNKCPLCKGNLAKLIRIYEIDKQMEYYKWSPELKQDIENKRKIRIAELMKNMELDKNSYSRKLTNYCESVQCSYEKHGIWGGLRRFINLASCYCYSFWTLIVIAFFIGKYSDVDLRPLLVWFHNFIGKLIELEDKSHPTHQEQTHFNWPEAEGVWFDLFGWIHEKVDDFFA